MMFWLSIVLVMFLSADIADPAPGQTYAVVVGISDYKILSYHNGDLQYADKDARRMAQFLQSIQGGSVPLSHIRLLLNEDATKSAIIQALSLFEKAKPGDRVIFYFSGHGLTHSFVPFDVRPNTPQTLLLHTDVKQAFRASQATTKLCVADACFAGAMTQLQRPPKTTGQHPAVPGESTVAMLLAARSTQVAIEQGRLAGGTFTYFLLKGLAGGADADANRIVTIRELHDYVSPRVRQVTPNRQAPIFYGKFPDNLPLAYL